MMPVRCDVTGGRDLCEVLASDGSAALSVDRVLIQM